MKKAKLFMMLALLVMGVSNLFAQNVTIRPDNGSMLCNKKTGGGDTFFNWGGFSTWKHEQLSLTMTTGDSDNNLNQGNNGGILNPLTSSGQLANPANDIFASADGKNLQIGKGRSSNANNIRQGMDTYLTISLPKGYRFTGYTIKFHRISKPDGDLGNDPVNEWTGSIEFGETNNSFAYRSTTSSNTGTYRGNIAQGSTTQYTITRTSQTANDMDNLLYFKLSNGRQYTDNTGRAFIQLDHVELFFTAEANYTPLIPAPNANGRSAVDISFLTSKLDYGTISPQTDGGDERLGYGGTVYELNGKLAFYEDGSVTADQNNGFDGTVGKMVDYTKSGSISTEGDYFKLDASKHGHLTETGDTAIYYIEAPIWATYGDEATAHKHPIGYRIVGASFDYAGVKTTYVPAIFRILFYDEDEDWNYGLNYQSRQYNGNESNQTSWRIDEYGYIYYGNYYLRVTTGWFDDTPNGITTTNNKSNATRFEIVTNTNNGTKQICIKDNPSYYIGWEKYTDWRGRVTRNVVLTTSEDNRAFYNELSAASGGNVTPYTFLIYDKTGAYVAKKVVVNSEIDNVLSIDSLNNDAVKIGIIGTGYIKGHVKLQALDPYINRLDIVCQEQGGNGGKLTQQFNSTDFSVRGGKFTFYVPEDFKAPALFTFDNLYSNWGDDTYYGETNSTNHARYYFVGSTYAGYENNDVYKRYNNKIHRNADYTTKISCLKPGNIAYTFNNAATISNGQVFEEYPFSVARYQNAGGNFNTDFIFTQEEMGATPAVEKTRYLFTCDETRYNIAPTTGTQHVYYAYYEMTIEMEKKTYNPVLNWVKLYDETFYADENGHVKTDSKWGLNVTTTETVDDNGRHSGYLTVSQIVNAINNRGKGNTVTGGPETSDQILYIDASNLMSIVENQTPSTTVNGDEQTVSYTSHKMNELLTKPDHETGLDKNALIYLPYGSQANYDNFAYNTIAKYNETPYFLGANNIVITDRYPFFAPHDIQVDAAKMLKYDRLLTPAEGYNNVVNATVMLPFTIKITEGVHDPKAKDASLTSASPFTLSTMNSDAALSKEKGYDYGTGYFTALEDTISKANYPYVVTVDGKQSGNYNFYVRQTGARVVATPASVNENSTANGIFTGTASYGSVDGTDYTLTPTGTYMGKQIKNAKSASPAVFYFSKDCFVTTRTLGADLPLNILPFRSFYEYPATATAKMTSFRIVFGENDEMGGTNGINEIGFDTDLAVIPGSRSITLMARADKNVTIHAVNGQTVDKCNLRAGESRTISVPAGVYVINGVKMVVK